jgi:hypothetical protein
LREATNSQTRLETRLAVLSALAALLGVVLGGTIGYLSNRALQDHESATAARGAARAYQASLLQAADKFTLMLEAGRTVEPKADLPPDLNADDKLLLASELTAEQWADVLRSEAALRDLMHLEALAGARNRGLQISAPMCEALSAPLSALSRGVTALADVAQSDPPLPRRSASGLACAAQPLIASANVAVQGPP